MSRTPRPSTSQDASLEMMATYGYTRRDKAIERAIQSFLKEQEPDGSWFGRWGVNYLYWHLLVLRGLEAIACGITSPRSNRRRSGSARCRTRTAAGARVCHSYDDPVTRGVGCEHALADGVGDPRIALCG